MDFVLSLCEILSNVEGGPASARPGGAVLPCASICSILATLEDAREISALQLEVEVQLDDIRPPHTKCPPHETFRARASLQTVQRQRT